MPPWLVALEASALTAWLRESAWAVPGLELAHLVGLVMAAGGAAAFDLRLLRAGPAGLGEWGYLLRWAWAGLLLAAASGLLLFAESPIELYLNPAFRLKLALLLLAGLNAWAFHRRVYPRAAGPAARAAAVCSLLLWLAVLAAGHLIKYV